MPDLHTVRTIHSICVFCGANVGASPEFAVAAASLGRLLAGRGVTLVYGGGQVGLMGVLADAALSAGGRVVGVIPEALATKELLHPGATQMHVVPSMHARKAKMAELADAFLALPGGYGTLEEFFEVVTWGQLGIHAKPIGLLNTRGYFDPLVNMIDVAIDQRFIKPRHRDLIVLGEQPEEMLDRLAVHRPPKTRKWIEPEDS